MGATQQPGFRGAGSSAHIRLLSAFGALGAGATAVVLGVLLVRGLPAIAESASPSLAGSGTSVTPAPSSPSSPAGFPAPPRGAVVFGAEAGANALGLAVVPRNGSVLLQASVIGLQGTGENGLAIRFDVRGSSGEKATASGTPCGAGCYRSTVAVAHPQSVAVTVGLTKPARVSFALPAAWPAPPAAGIVKRAGAVWRSLHALVIHDVLSDGHFTLTTDWKIVAPDRIEFQINGGGGAAIIIGDRRWDKIAHTSRWLAAAQAPVQQPVPFWQGATNARLLGTVSVHGRPSWKVSFFDPGTPGWFTIVVDKATMHTTELWMTANAHFMHQTYGSFNAPIKITPPS